MLMEKLRGKTSFIKNAISFGRNKKEAKKPEILNPENANNQDVFELYLDYRS